MTPDQITALIERLRRTIEDRTAASKKFGEAGELDLADNMIYSRLQMARTAYEDAVTMTNVTALLDHVAALQAENAGLRRDAERMDWLCEHATYVCLPLPYGARNMFGPANPRTQIDAAMKEPK